MRQAQILILEIRECIPVVKIFAFLELKQNLAFFKGLIFKNNLFLGISPFLKTIFFWAFLCNFYLLRKNLTHTLTYDMVLAEFEWS
jgi:hypothetical protein